MSARQPSRHSRRILRPRTAGAALFESVESRELLSASPLHFSFHGPAIQGVFGHGHGNIAPTPIANLTGNPLTFSEVVGLPAVQKTMLPGLHDDDGLVGQDIATITSSTLPVSLKGYSVSVDWGDGTSPTKGFLFVDNTGLIHVKGLHSYSSMGTFSVTITLTQLVPAVQSTATPATSLTLSIVSTANVTQNSLNGLTITPTTGQPFTGTLGTFTIPPTDTSTDPTTFTALIKWGDNSHPFFTQGIVTLNNDGSYSVAGTHTYAAAGTYRIAIVILQHDPGVSVTSNAQGNGYLHFVHQLPVINTIFSTATVTDPVPAG